MVSLLGVLLRIGIGVGLLGYLTLSGAIDWAALVNLGRSWPLTLLALAILALDVGLTGYRLCILLRPRGLHLSITGSTRLTLIGQFFNSCLPGAAGGDLVRIYYAIGGDLTRKTEVATIMLLDRAVAMFALLVFPVIVLPWFPHVFQSMDVIPELIGGGAILAGGLLCFVIVAFSDQVRNSTRLARLSNRLPLRDHIGRMWSTIHAYRENKKTLLAVVGVSLVVHTLAIGTMLILASLMNPSGLVWEIALLIPLGMLANALPLSPGGIGVGEAAFESLFRLAGLTGGAEILLGWRVLTFLIGLVGLGFYLQGRKAIISDQPLKSRLTEEGAETAGSAIGRLS